MNAMELGERKGLLLRIGVSCVASIASLLLHEDAWHCRCGANRARSRVTDVIVLPGQARYGLTLLLLQVLAMVAISLVVPPRKVPRQIRPFALRRAFTVERRYGSSV